MFAQEVERALQLRREGDYDTSFKELHRLNQIAPDLKKAFRIPDELRWFDGFRKELYEGLTFLPNDVVLLVTCYVFETQLTSMRTSLFWRARSLKRQVSDSSEERMRARDKRIKLLYDNLLKQLEYG